MLSPLLLRDCRNLDDIVFLVDECVGLLSGPFSGTGVNPDPALEDKPLLLRREPNKYLNNYEEIKDMSALKMELTLLIYTRIQ